MTEKPNQKVCPNCKAQNDLTSLACTFCGYVFGTKKSSQNVTSMYRVGPPEKKWTQQHSNLGPGGKGSEEGIDGTNLSWADNQNLGWANLEDEEGEGSDPSAPNDSIVKPSDPNSTDATKYKKKVIGLCVKCGRNLYDTKYQQESISFLEKNKIKPNFHKYIKNGMMLLCPTCFNNKLNEMQRR